MSEGLLSRWARRKQEVRRQARAETRVEPSEPPAASEPQALADAELSGAEALDDESLADAIARLPEIEDLTAETELAPFLRAGIPAALRKAALRRMWSVDPAIRDFVSEARDYAYDWNTPGGVPGLGPMLPTDDIKAMVERIMTGHAPRPPEETPEERPGIPEGAVEVAPTNAPGTDDAETEVSPARAPALGVQEAPPALVAQDAPLAHVDAADLHPAKTSARTFQSPPIVSSLRRHGGAMPS